MENLIMKERCKSLTDEDDSQTNQQAQAMTINQMMYLQQMQALQHL
jgi:hypothetical protein